MKNLKIRVFNEKESKEAQDLLYELGAYTNSKDWLDNAKWLFLEKDMKITFSSTLDYHSDFEYKEVTILKLRDMVVLNRKSWKDATHETDRDDNDDLYYVSSDGRVYYWFCGDHWVYSGYCYRGNLKPISNKEDLKMKTSEMKQRLIKNGCSAELAEEILLKTKGEYETVIKSSTSNSWWAWKDDNNYVINCFNCDDWFLRGEDYCTFEDFNKRDIVVDDIRNLKEQKPELTISDKVKYFEMFLKGKKLQYHLGVFVEGKSQWHNLTDKSLHVLQRSDVNIREKPKYVRLDGIEFKTKESLLKHVESHYDLS